MNQLLIHAGAVCAFICLFLGGMCQGEPAFDSAQLVIDSTQLNTPFDFNITFRPTRMIGVNELIVVKLPRFSRGLAENTTASNVTYGNLLIAPSYSFVARFLSGKNMYDDRLEPYSSAELHIMPLNNLTFAKQIQYTITVFKENGIGAVCGFPSTQVVNETGIFTYPFKPFEILTARVFDYPTLQPSAEPTTFTAKPSNDPSAVPSAEPSVSEVPSAEPSPMPSADPSWSFTPTLYHPTIEPTLAPTAQPLFYRNDSYEFDFFSGLGQGCAKLNSCNRHGQCDYCHEKCYCFEGFGSDSDLLQTGRNVQPDCSSRTCPAGKAFADIPTGTNKAHAVAECSSRGQCDRATGQCKCFPPFTGSACERMSCPNDCSGHGTCMTMAELSRARALENPRKMNFEYGSSQGFATVAWDHDVVQGCLCDSSWAVGYKSGETQLAEWFGGDCSQKRCPSGDDPYTTVVETNCLGISQIPGDPERGFGGNKCHIECSRRGTCNHKTGVCTCFEGSWGQACENIANAGRRAYESGADADTFWLAGGNDSIIVEGN